MACQRTFKRKVVFFAFCFFSPLDPGAESLLRLLRTNKTLTRRPARTSGGCSEGYNSRTAAGMGDFVCVCDMKMSCFSSVFICKTLKAPLRTHYTCSSGSVSHRLWLSMNRFSLEGSGTSWRVTLNTLPSQTDFYLPETQSTGPFYCCVTDPVITALSTGRHNSLL